MGVIVYLKHNEGEEKEEEEEEESQELRGEKEREGKSLALCVLNGNDFSPFFFCSCFWFLCGCW